MRIGIITCYPKVSAMKTRVLIALLLVSIYLPPSCRSADTPRQLTNCLAFHLVVDEISREVLMKTNASPYGLRLIAEPVLSDPDFVAWDTMAQAFVITPTAVKRLAGVISHTTPFVLMASGEPIYLGLFTSPYTSRSSAIPEIKTGPLIVVRCFMGITNVPRHLLQMIGDPGVTERLNALTNAVTNVTLRIDQGLFAGHADRRTDQRISAAAAKLFRNREN
jgi:hypothetical protein